jgi:DeoR/GlpR family transcriptional regulator of sugar metabolism
MEQRDRLCTELVRGGALEAGRRLGVSVRTVRRDIADLMTEHGGKSQLELGAALAGSLVSRQ